MFCQSCSAFFRVIDPLYDFFQTFDFKKGTGVPGRAVIDQAPLFLIVLCQNDDLVKQFKSAVRAVGDDHNDLALIRNGAQIFPQLPGHGSVQAGVRLIQEKQRGVSDIFHSNAEAFSLSAAQLDDKRIPQALQTQQVQGFFDMLFVFFLFHDRQPHPGCVEQCVVDGIVLSEQIFLRNITDLIFHLFVFFVDICPFIADLAFGRFITHDRVHEGGLSGTGSAENQYHAPG